MTNQVTYEVELPSGKVRWFQSGKLDRSQVEEKTGGIVRSAKVDDATPIGDATATADMSANKDLNARGVSQLLGQGSLLGFGDEFVAGVESNPALSRQILSGGHIATGRHADELRQLEMDNPAPSYGDVLTRERDGLSNLRGQYPAESFGVELAGSVPVATLAATEKIASKGRPIVEFAKRYAPLAAEGSAMGAGLSEASIMDDPMKVVGAAAAGGTIGFGLGASLAGISNAATPALRGLWQRMVEMPEQTAYRMIRQNLENDKITPEEAMELVDAYEKTGRKAAVVDMGEENLAELEGAANRRGGGRRQVQDWADERGDFETRAERLRAGLTDAENQNKAGYFEYLDELDARRAAGSTLYEDFKAMTIAGGERAQLDRILERPLVAKYYADAPKKIRSTMDADDTTPISETMRLDKTVRSIQQDIDASYRAGLGDDANALITMRDDLTAEIDKVTKGAYKQARSEWAGIARTRDAAERGRKFVTSEKSVIDLERDMAQWGDAEMEAFQIGALQGVIDDIVEKGATSAAANKVLKTSRVRKLIRKAFPDERSYVNWVEGLKQEKRMARSEAATQGSPTARRAEFRKEQSGGLLASGMNDIGNVLARVGRAIANLRSEVSPEVSTHIARILTQDLDDKVIKKLFEKSALNTADSASAYARGAAGVLALPLTEKVVGE